MSSQCCFGSVNTGTLSPSVAYPRRCPNLSQCDVFTCPSVATPTLGHFNSLESFDCCYMYCNEARQTFLSAIGPILRTTTNVTTLLQPTNAQQHAPRVGPHRSTCEPRSRRWCRVTRTTRQLLQLQRILAHPRRRRTTTVSSALDNGDPTGGRPAGTNTARTTRPPPHGLEGNKRKRVLNTLLLFHANW